METKKELIAYFGYMILLLCIIGIVAIWGCDTGWSIAGWEVK